MRRNKQSILALILAALMLLPACSESNENNDETKAVAASPVVTEAVPADETTAENDEERIQPNIPATADFGGEEILFFVWDRAGWANTVRKFRDIYSEGVTGESINDIVYNRNVKIEESYKVKIRQETESDGTITGTISTSIAAGETTYDVVYPRLANASSLFSKGEVHNFMEVPNIDLDMPWWDQNCKDSLMLHGYLPCVATSLNVNDKDASSAVAFNKKLATDFNIEDPYTVVREGKWTYDKISELSDAADQDVNGDGKLTEDDIYGFLGARDVMETFWYGSGGLMVTRDEDQSFQFTFGSERDLSAAEKIINMMQQPWFFNHHLHANDDNIYRQLFETGHGLFFWMRLDDVTNMRASDTDFGILPIPKYDETQDKYYSQVSRYTTGLPSIPVTLGTEQLSMVGMILEAMSAASHYDLQPEYIETSLKTKNSRDAESADMLDLIISNRVYCPMHVYNYGGFHDKFLRLGDAPNTGLASFLKTQQKVVSKNIEKTMEKIAEMAEYAKDAK